MRETRIPPSDPPGPQRPARAGAEQTGWSPKRIGDYEILGLIAQGGMGNVYKAVQSSPRRTVAVKVMRRGIMSPDTVRRFEFESQVMARLRHPGIAQIYESGMHREGDEWIPYFVMEYVPHARKITEFAALQNLGLEERLRLFAKVCEAIRHGHQKGVIHRDLKPDNILIDCEDEVPTPKVIDFGVARATDSDIAAATFQTTWGDLLGTLQYMSPEQVAGDSDEIDTRTDVYSLGLVLYELLAGEPPYDVQGAPIHEAVRTIRDANPPRLGSRDRRLRGDLDTLVGKALEKDKERRYESVSALLADIRRYLNHEPLAARPPSLLYQVGSFARRNKAAFGAALAVFLVSVAAALVSTNLAITARRNAKEAREKEMLATRQAYRAHLNLAALAAQERNLSETRELLLGAEPTLRGWEWRHLNSRLDASLETPFPGGRGFSRALFTQDGSRLIATHTDGGLSTWDATSGQGLGSTRMERPCHLIGLLGGTERALCATAGHESFEGWNAETGRRFKFVSMPPGISSPVRPDPANKRYLFGEGTRLSVRDLETDREIASAGFERAVEAVAADPLGRHLAVGAGREVHLLDAMTLEDLSASGKEHRERVSDLVFSPDGTMLVSVGLDDAMRLWDLGEGDLNLRAVLRGHRGEVTAVAWSPSGGLLASGGIDGGVRLWEGRTGVPRGLYGGHGSTVVSLSFRPGSAEIYSLDARGKLLAWSTLGDVMDVLRGHRSFVYPVAFSPDGAMVLSGGWDGYVGSSGALRFWDAETGLPVARWGEAGLGVLAATYTGDGSRVVASLWNDVSGETPDVVLLDASTGGLVRTFDGHGDSRAFSLMVHPDGRRVVSVDESGTALVWELETGRIQARIDAGPVHVPLDGMGVAAALSPDGDLLALMTGHRGIRLVRIADNRILREWEAHDDRPRSLAFHPRERRLLSTSDDRTVRVWDLDTGRRIAMMRGHGEPVLCAAYSPDGSRIASGGRDGYVRIWDAESHEHLAALGGHEDYIYSVAWSRDGETLVSGSGDGTVRLWGTRGQRERLTARRAYRSALERIEPQVRIWLEEADPAEVFGQIGEDATLTEVERRVARHVLLRATLE